MVFEQTILYTISFGSHRISNSCMQLHIVRNRSTYKIVCSHVYVAHANKSFGFSGTTESHVLAGWEGKSGTVVDLEIFSHALNDARDAVNDCIAGGHFHSFQLHQVEASVDDKILWTDSYFTHFHIAKIMVV